MPSDCGIFQVALSVASFLPEASGVGYVSMPVTGRDLPRRAAGDRDRPDVPPLDVLRVRAVVERLAVGGEGDRGLVFDQPVGRRQQHRRRGRRRDVERVVAIPFVDGSGRAGAGARLRSPRRRARRARRRRRTETRRNRRPGARSRGWSRSASFGWLCQTSRASPVADVGLHHRSV